MVILSSLVNYNTIVQTIGDHMTSVITDTFQHQYLHKHDHLVHTFIIFTKQWKALSDMKICDFYGVQFLCQTLIVITNPLKKYLSCP